MREFTQREQEILTYFKNQGYQICRHPGGCLILETRPRTIVEHGTGKVWTEGSYRLAFGADIEDLYNNYRGLKAEGEK